MSDRIIIDNLTFSFPLLILSITMDLSVSDGGGRVSVPN